MEILREMVQVLTKSKTKNIEVLGNPTEEKSQVYQFYEGISDGTFTSDEAAAAYFFDGNVRNQSYKNLKTKLKNRLLNTVFFVEANQSMYNEYEKAYVNCYKDWAAAKILLMKSAKKSGINICLKVLKQALKVDFADIIIEVCRVLRNQYGSVEYDSKKFDYYNELLKKNSKIRDKELLAEECYLKLIRYYLKNKSPKKDLLEEATRYSELLYKDFNQLNTFNIIVLGGMVEVIKLMCVNNYKDTAELCNKVVVRLQSKDIIWRAGMATFFFQEIICRIQLKQLIDGEKAIEMMFKYIENGRFNWFKGKELQMNLLFHTGQYNDAFYVYKEVNNHKRYENVVPQSIKETWKIFKAYIHFLIKVEKIQLESEDKEFSKFKLGKFLNEVPGFSQDKRGANIAILVIQILFTIIQKNYNRAIDRIETIEKYTSRYLKKDNNFRSNCFIKMLLEISKNDFHKVAVERKATKHRKRLAEMPLEIANQAHSIEIIPYEELWEMALNLLDRKRHKARR